MTSIKIKFRPSTVEGKEGSIFFQIIHNRVACLLKYGFQNNCIKLFRSRCSHCIGNAGFRLSLSGLRCRIPRVLWLTNLKLESRTAIKNIFSTKEESYFIKKT